MVRLEILGGLAKAVRINQMANKQHQEYHKKNIEYPINMNYPTGQTTPTIYTNWTLQQILQIWCEIVLPHAYSLWKQHASVSLYHCLKLVQVIHWDCVISICLNVLHLVLFMLTFWMSSQFISHDGVFSLFATHAYCGIWILGQVSVLICYFHFCFSYSN